LGPRGYERAHRALAPDCPPHPLHERAMPAAARALSATGAVRPLKGIAAMIAGMAFLTLSDAISKYLAEAHPIGQVMCLRQAACLLFVFPFVWRGAGLGVLRPHNVSLQILRGLVFLISGSFIIWSL